MMTQSLHRLARLAPRAWLALGLALVATALPAVASAAEEEAGGIAALGFSLPGLITQLINFGILLVVLRLFLYGPLLKVLDERKRRIQEGIDAAASAASAAAGEGGFTGAAAFDAFTFFVAGDSVPSSLVVSSACWARAATAGDAAASGAAAL